MMIARIGKDPHVCGTAHCSSPRAGGACMPGCLDRGDRNSLGTCLEAFGHSIRPHVLWVPGLLAMTKLAAAPPPAWQGMYILISSRCAAVRLKVAVPSGQPVNMAGAGREEEPPAKSASGQGAAAATSLSLAMMKAKAIHMHPPTPFLNPLIMALHFPGA